MQYSAKQYATALSSAVSGDVVALAAEIQRLATIVRIPAVRRSLLGPRLTGAQRTQLIQQMLAHVQTPKELIKPLTGLLLVLIANKALTLLPRIAQVIDPSVHPAVFTAQVSNVSSAVSKTFGTKEITALENPDLIGGFVFRSGDDVFDASLKNDLEKIKNELIH